MESGEPAPYGLGKEPLRLLYEALVRLNVFSKEQRRTKHRKK
jgi:hypothetical protein